MRSITRLSLASLGIVIPSMFGCAPQFVEEPVAPKPTGWVERDVEHHSHVLADYVAPEITYAEDVNLLSSWERVSWIEGVNRQSSRIQQKTSLPHQIVQDTADEDNLQTLVRAHFIEIDPQTGELTLKGRLQVENFKAVSGRRYFVEFFYQDGMNEVQTMEMTARWVILSKSLKEKGLDPKKVVMGGANYRQNRHGILLIELR